MSVVFGGEVIVNEVEGLFLRNFVLRLSFNTWGGQAVFSVGVNSLDLPH